MPTLKSPQEPVLLSDKSCQWLDDKLKQNERRRKLNKFEEELFEGAKSFDREVKSFL